MDILEKIKLLPLDKQKEVEDIVDFLSSKYRENVEDIKSLAEQRRKHLDSLKGKIWMADDFNETPEEFNEYI